MPDASAHCKRSASHSAGALAEQDLAHPFLPRQVVLPLAGDVERERALHGWTREHGVEPAAEMGTQISRPASN
jgi:hypothetical protein